MPGLPSAEVGSQPIVEWRSTERHRSEGEAAVRDAKRQNATASRRQYSPNTGTT